MDRRRFLLSSASCAAALALPAWLDARPEDGGLLPGARRPAGPPVRVTGRVRARGDGLGGVAVTDGLRVVETAADGSFELRTTADREFVSLSVPSGHRIPARENGVARAYRPLSPGDDGEMEAVFDLEPLPVDDENHHMLLLPDIQTEDRTEMEWFHARSVPDVRETVAGIGDGHVFGIACGDIMYDRLELFDEYDRAVSRMGVPFFQVVGNHDLDMGAPTDRGSDATFSGRYGPRYYSFDRGAVHYVVLDDVFWYGGDYIGYLDAEQLAWLEADLARIEPGRTVIVAQHIPLEGTAYLRRGRDEPRPHVAVANRDALYSLLEPYDAHVLCGHMHENEHIYRHGVHEHVCGTVSGAWWSGPICGDGTPSGYAVYEVRGEEVRWRYKSTGHPEGHQIRAYPRGADPGAPDEFVANVWDWDPGWTVLWYEDGQRRGPMARRTGKDPLSRRLHAGPEKPERRTWVDPYETRHLFYAPVGSDHGELRVEVTDRFGRTRSTRVPDDA
jgi:hypothetical protein